jgi:hypothetical protein
MRGKLKDGRWYVLRAAGRELYLGVADSQRDAIDDVEGGAHVEERPAAGDITPEQAAAWCAFTLGGWLAGEDPFG